MKINEFKLISFGFFLLNPLFALPFFKNFKISDFFPKFIISFSLAYLFMGIEPAGDVAKYYQLFEQGLGDFQQYLSIIDSNRFGILVPSELYLIKVFGLKKEFLIFSHVFICVYLFINILSYLYANKRELFPVKVVYLLLIVLLIINYKGIALGIRFWTSAYFVIYANFLYLQKKRIKMYFFFLFSYLIHPGVIVYFLLHFFSSILKNKNVIFVFYISLFFIIIPKSIWLDGLLSIIRNYDYYLLNKLAFYMDSQWGGDLLESKSTLGYIYFHFGKLRTLVAAYIIFIFRRDKGYLFNFLIFSFAFNVVFFDFFTLYFRYAIVPFTLSVLYFIFRMERSFFNWSLIFVIFISALLQLADLSSVIMPFLTGLERSAYPMIYRLLFESVDYVDYL